MQLTKNPEGPIETPIPKHAGCAVCNEYFKDYKAHIASKEHKKMFYRQEDLLN
jgi:hypothetical protein